MAAAGRNDPCPCGSGRKFKHCCLGAGGKPQAAPPRAAAQLLDAGRQHHRAGRLVQAESLYRQALQLQPDSADALNLLAVLAQAAGNHPAAIDLLRQAVAVDDRIAGLHYNLGISWRALNRPAEAVEAYEAAVRCNPRFAEAHYDLGRALAELGRLADAVASYQRALAIKPQFAEACNNLGIAMGRQGRLADAVACFRKAVTIRPDYANAWCNLGFALFNQARPDDAVVCYRRALAMRPGMAAALGNLQVSLLAQGDAEAALACSREAMRVEQGDAWAYSARICSTLYLEPVAPAELWSLHQSFAACFEAPLVPERRPLLTDAHPARRLRVGYISPNLHAHSVAFFLEPILANHDRSEVEVFCYSDSVQQDATSDRLAGYADHWRRSAGWPDTLLAEQIRSDGIDVLVDLAGHTQDNRLLVFARKPAPVQVAYLGYAATTGLRAMDYRLVTADTDPPGAEDWHSERLYRLPRTLWCYRPAPGAPDPGSETPAVRNGYVTFCSSNNVAKLSPAAMSLWGRILQQLPGSRLVFTGIPEGSVRDRLVARFAGFGMDAARITVYGRLPAAEFHAVCAGVDLALDTFPYNGTTTTCELLWLGVPVIALEGQTSVSRSGHAILRSVGLGALVAADADAYVRTATALARDPGRLSALRAGLRRRIEASPLRDEAAMARDIEAAYRTMWQAWCEGTDQAGRTGGA